MGIEHKINKEDCKFPSLLLLISFPKRNIFWCILPECSIHVIGSRQKTMCAFRHIT